MVVPLALSTPVHWLPEVAVALFHRSLYRMKLPAVLEPHWSQKSVAEAVIMAAALKAASRKLFMVELAWTSRGELANERVVSVQRSDENDRLRASMYQIQMEDQKAAHVGPEKNLAAQSQKRRKKLMYHNTDHRYIEKHVSFPTEMARCVMLHRSGLMLPDAFVGTGRVGGCVL